MISQRIDPITLNRNHQYDLWPIATFVGYYWRWLAGNDRIGRIDLGNTAILAREKARARYSRVPAIDGSKWFVHVMALAAGFPRWIFAAE